MNWFSRRIGQGNSKSSKKTKDRKKTLTNVLDKALITQAQSDKDWALQMALKKEGLTIDSPAEKQQKKIDEFVTTKAFERLQDEDSEILDDAVKDKIAGIIIGSGKSKRHRGESDYYPEPGSAISSALDEIETLGELKEKLAEMGMVGGGGGFLQGMTLKDILEALPSVAALMGKGAPVAIEGGQLQRTYVVKVNGQDKEVSEIEYRKLLQDGKLTPVAALVEPAKEEEQVIEEEIVTEEQQPSFDLSGLLDNLDPEVIGTYLDMEPEEFVITLKADADAGEDIPKFLWGFFSNTDYEGIVKHLTPYREKEEWRVVVERILSDDGRGWVERVIELVTEMRNEQ